MRGLLLPILLVALLLAVRLSAPMNLMSGDQGKSAQYVLYSWQTGDFVVPLEKGHILPTKPPLPTWISLLSCRLAGAISELAVRIPSAVLGLLLVLLTYLIARRVAPSPVPEVACLVVAANYIFLKSASLVRPDMTLAVTVAAAVYTGDRALRSGGLIPALLTFLFLGLGVLAKGPIAVLVVGLALVPWMMLRGEAASLRRLRPLVGILVLVAVVAVWAVPAWIQNGPALAKVMIVDELSRHAGGGRKPIYNYLFVFPGRFVPWVIFLPFGLVAAWRSRRAPSDWPLGLPFCWFVFSFLTLSLVGSKRAEYLLPALPAAAILVAWSFLRSKVLTKVLIGVVGGALLLALAATAVLGPGGIADLIPKRKPPMVTLAGLIQLRYPMLLGALAVGVALSALAWLAAWRERMAAAALTLFGLFVAGTAMAFHGFPELKGEFASTPDFAARAVAESEERNVPILVHGIRSGANGLLFYLGKPEPVADEETVREAAGLPGGVLVVTTPQVDEQLNAGGLRTTAIHEAEQVPGKLSYRLVLASSPQ